MIHVCISRQIHCNRILTHLHVTGKDDDTKRREGRVAIERTLIPFSESTQHKYYIAFADLPRLI